MKRLQVRDSRSCAARWCAELHHPQIRLVGKREVKIWHQKEKSWLCDADFLGLSFYLHTLSRAQNVLPCAHPPCEAPHLDLARGLRLPAQSTPLHCPHPSVGKMFEPFPQIRTPILRFERTWPRHSASCAQWLLISTCRRHALAALLQPASCRYARRDTLF